MADKYITIIDVPSQEKIRIKVIDNGDGTYAIDSKVTLNVGDIEIGQVELKDSDSTAQANIKAANTARTTGTVVVATQNIDTYGKPSLHMTPSVVALARTVDATISASTEITLNGSTTFIRVYAIDQDIYLKWGTDDVTASNFDEVIPANQICDFYVPASTTAVNFIERTATATLICIEK